jgi:hypothetical protein
VRALDEIEAFLTNWWMRVSLHSTKCIFLFLIQTIDLFLCKINFGLIQLLQ